MAWLEGVSYVTSDFRLSIPRWDFPDGGISCIFGESGSGKTTLLQIMAGLLPLPHKLCVSGEMISELPVRSRNIGFVFQDYSLFPHMTAYENIKFAADAKGLIPEMWSSHGDKLLKRLDLEKIKNQRTQILSGGEQQRVALARALITKPKILLLDEPLSALDETRRQTARDLLSELSDEFRVPFILVTHDLRDVRNLSQNMIFLENGTVIGYGKTEDVLSKPSQLSIARVLPENQILNAKVFGDSTSKITTTNIQDGPEDLVVAKNWSFQIGNIGQGDLRGTIIKVVNEGPYSLCSVRLSTGQIIKAMAPLNSVPSGEVQLKVIWDTLVLFKGS